MTNNPLKPLGDSLSVSTPTLWPDVLSIDEDEFEGDLPIPAHMALPDDGFTDSDMDEIMRAQVTPDMRAALKPSQREMLVNLQADVRGEKDPLNSVRLMSRMATAASYGAVPLPVVLTAFAEAVKEFDPQPFHQLYYFAHLHLAAFTKQSARNSKPATPAFNYDEYGAMATYVHSQGLEALTALNEREFFYNDERISTHHVNSIIDAHLRTCEIWDSHRGVRVAVSNRQINEVRGAMARMWPRWSDPSPDASDKSLSLAGPRYAQRVASFGGDRTCLNADAWTSSAALWQAWQDVCASRSEPSGASSTFFKELTRWSGGRIHRSKKGKGPHRVPGYSGIKMI
jgi:hypothetical protein